MSQQTDYRQLPNFERKEIPTFIKQYDEDQGVVEHFVAIFGNLDDGGDIIEPGSFRKTITERGRRIKVLDMHQTDSVLRVIGKPIGLREASRSELTPEVLEYAPSATGGLLATTQYALKTDNGRNVFELIKGGFLPESSIGYDPITVSYEKLKMPDGSEKTVRLLKEIRLWEYSNVIFGMNPATVVVSAKSNQKQTLHDYTYNGVTCQASRRRSSSRDDKKYERTVKYDDTEKLVHYGDPNMEMRRDDEEARANFLSRHNCDEKTDPFSPGYWACYDWANPDEKESNVTTETKEAKPYGIVPEGDRFAVYRMDEDGQPMGDPMGMHDTEDDAQAQVDALYAEEEKAIRNNARTPQYNGTETTSWANVSKSMADYINGYYEHTGADKPDEAVTTVAGMPSAMKTWIANRSLLGNAASEQFNELLFFPVVNPSTDKLNEGALRAVISGRGAAANIAEAAKTSAQNKARQLLQDEFDMGQEEDKSTDNPDETKSYDNERFIGPVLQGVLYGVVTNLTANWLKCNIIDLAELQVLNNTLLTVLNQMTLPEDLAMRPVGYGYGEMAYMSADTSLEQKEQQIKAGRTISATNAERLRSIMQMMQQFMADTGIMPMMDDMPEDDELSPSEEDSKNAPVRAASTQQTAKAGPETPTSKKDLLKQIEIATLELEFMEV